MGQDLILEFAIRGRVTAGGEIMYTFNKIKIINFHDCSLKLSMLKLFDVEVRYLYL